MNRLLILFFVCVVDVLGFGIMIPLLPYMGDRFGASPAVITWLLMAYAACQFVATPFWGRLSDRLGRRPILLTSLAGACVSYLILGFAQSLLWLLAWTVFLLSALSERDGRRVRTHTLLDDIEIEL